MNGRIPFRGLLLLSGFLCWGCGAGDEDQGAPSLSPGAARARAEELASRHLLQEALDLIERSRPAPPVGDWSVAEASLRQIQAGLLVSLARYREAVALLDELIRRQPEIPDHRRQRVRALLGIGGYSRAREELEFLSAAERSESLLLYARALAGEDRFAESIALAAAVLVRNPWRDEAYLVLGRALVRSGRREDGHRFLLRYRSGEAYRKVEQEALAAEQAGETGRALNLRAGAEDRRGRLYEAMMLNRKAIARSPAYAPPYLDLARMSIFLEHPEDAIKGLESLPARPEVLALRAEAYEASGDLANARGALDQALALEPGRKSLREHRLKLEGDVPAEPGDEFKEARAVVRAALRGVPISQGVDELLKLADVYETYADPVFAGYLVLFLSRLAPANEAVLRRFLDYYSAGPDIFLRTWARLRAGDPQAPFEELSSLGIEPAAVSRALKGEIAGSTGE